MLHGAFPYATLVVALAALYSTAPLFVFLRTGGWSFYPGALFRILVVRVFLWVQLGIVPVCIAALGGLAIGVAMGRPLEVARWAASGAAVVVITAYLLGYAGSRRLITTRLTLKIPGLPAAFDGMTIAQMSDLHVGPQTSRRFLRRIRRTIEGFRADLIVVPGDLIDDRPEDVPLYAAAFGGMRAPLGVFATPGNHDIYQGWDAVAQGLRNADVGTLLVNESRLLSRDGETLAIVGLGDPAGRMVRRPDVAPDIDRALGGVPPGTTIIALAHNPVLWPALAARGVALTLSGHTHWGQFALPRLRWSIASLFLEHDMGWYRVGDAQLYIGAGTGHWGIPFRIGAVGEVVHLTLRRG